MDTFGKRLKTAIDESGGTQADVARQIGVERSTISNLIAGRSNPSSQITKSLSTALSVSERWLSEGSGPRRLMRADLLNDYEAEIISEIRELKEPKRRITAKMLLAAIKAAKDE